MYNRKEITDKNSSKMGEAKRRKNLDPNYGKTRLDREIKPNIEALLRARKFKELKLLYIMAIKADSMKSPGIVLKSRLGGGQCVVSVFSHDELDNCDLSKDLIEKIKLELSLLDFSQHRIFVFEESSKVNICSIEVGLSDQIKQALIDTNVSLSFLSDI